MAVTKETTQLLKFNSQTYDNIEHEMQSLEAQRPVEKNNLDRDEVLIRVRPICADRRKFQRYNTRNEQVFKNFLILTFICLQRRKNLPNLPIYKCLFTMENF